VGFSLCSATLLFGCRVSIWPFFECLSLDEAEGALAFGLSSSESLLLLSLSLPLSLSLSLLLELSSLLLLSSLEEDELAPKTEN
jgi:hypothetical protein